jgi:hypothetical protein
MMVMVMKWGEWERGADGQWVSVSGKFPLLSNFSGFVFWVVAAAGTSGGCRRAAAGLQADLGEFG